MKRFLPAALLLSLLSCTGEKAEMPSSEIRVRVVGATKQAEQEPFDGVRTLDLLVFRSSDGMLESRSRQEGALSVSCSCTSGRELRWYLVANAPDELSFATESAFLEGVTRLSDQEKSIVMHAEGSVHLSGKPEGIEALLKRYPCKISLDAVRVKWMDSEGAPSEIRLGRIALINVLGACHYSGIPGTDGEWLNKAEAEDGSSLLFKDHGGTLIPSSDIFTCKTTLYALPNPTDSGINSSNTGPWCPRNTRLSVELLADGISYWYPVDLRAMEGNCHYRITELIITGPGASGPDRSISRNPLSFQLMVSPWDSVTSEIDFGGEAE